MMDRAITFTPSEFVQILSSTAALIIAINAAALIVAGWFKRIHKPEDEQNERLDNMEARMDNLERKHQLMYRDFEDSRQLLRALEVDNVSFRKVVVKGIQALTEHALNGDGHQALNKATEELNDYLLRDRKDTYND